MSLLGKSILVTGGARRIGRHLSLTAARAGAEVIIHHGHSPEEAEKTKEQIAALGSTGHIIQADLNQPEAVQSLLDHLHGFPELYGLINNASIFGDLTWDETTLPEWERHLQINLTAPFQLAQGFARLLLPDRQGKIINILDWRALRPGADHFPYTISKAALAAATRSFAAALAPHIQVNGLALGAVLPPSDGSSTTGLLDQVPMGRWAELQEVGETCLFLLEGPDYLTGEILHIDGGRHLI